MALITWSKEGFGTNVGMHDEEHRSIFGKLNTLHDTLGNGDRKAVGTHLDDLIDIVAKHFASEEVNLSKHNYHAFEAHKREHDKLVSTCLELQSKFRAGQAEVTPETTAFLRDWLIGHIPVIDRSYGPFLNSKGLS
jgi:hemerythrin